MEPGQEVESDGYKIELLSDEYAQYDLSFKIIFIGDSGVGKSCLSVKATKDVFENNYLATVGFEFFSFNVRVDDEKIKEQAGEFKYLKCYANQQVIKDI